MTGFFILMFIIGGFVFGVAQGIQKAIARHRAKRLRQASFDQARKELGAGKVK